MDRRRPCPLIPLHKLYEDDGAPTDIEISTVRPRQVLVIGSLSEFTDRGSANPEKITSMGMPGGLDRSPYSTFTRAFSSQRSPSSSAQVAREALAGRLVHLVRDAGITGRELSARCG
ncbi:hypothetical protein GCM10009574_096910 [Streptomyces asiaticus]|uniref:Uncharacterized protein n=2 Tax=Streptomyces rhizosphaericus TaxID=114699 RepID=A0ABP4BZZ1_9ACTN